MEIQRATRRRTVLGAAAVVMGGVVAAPGRAAAEGAGTSPDEVTDAFRVVDRRHRQRLLVSADKPPVIIGGRTYPAEQRQGPDHATYVIFNDDEGSEKGGIVASTTGASVSLDYPNAQAVTLATRWEGTQGAAVLFMKQMPDPTLPVEQVPPMPNRIELGYSTPEGAFLVLNDSAGRPRILLEVDGADRARIRILDADGEVVGQLPVESSG